MTISMTLEKILLFAGCFIFTAFAAQAGVLENGNWTPSGCGTRPEAPLIDSASPEAYNRSIGLVNTWQKELQAYHDCMIREANADAAAINRAATVEQARINEASQKVNADATAARSTVDTSRPAPAAPPMMQNQNY